MEVQPDSAISGQEASTDAGLGAVGQEAGHVEDRVNGLMSTLGRRTTELADAVTERDALRQQLADLMAGEPPVEAPGAALEEAQLPDTTDDADEALEPAAEPVAAAAAPPEPTGYELPLGSVVMTPDGSQFLVGSAGPGTIAPTSPSRSFDHPPATELEALRHQFDAQLPGAVADMRRRALLRGPTVS